MTKRLIIIRGIPGSGKSTYAQKLVNELTGEGKTVKHIESDMFFMKDGEYKFNMKLLGVAHKWCFDTVFNSFNENDTVIVSNTFTTMKELAPYMDRAKVEGYDTTIYRMANEFQNQHGVPEETLQAMKARFVDCESEVIIKE